MPNSPVLGLGMMTAAQAQKEVVFNNFLIAMDALFRGSVLDASLTTPPGSPALGDAYIVNGVGAGAWSGHNYQIAFYYNGWQFVVPPLKIRLYSVAQSEFFVWQGSSTHWTTEPASTVSVLGDLTNVSGSPTDGQVLTFINADGKWEPRTPTLPALTLHSMTDVNVTEGAGINGKALVWNQSDGKWEAVTVLLTNPNFLSLPDVNSTHAEGNIAVYSATAIGGTSPGVKFISPASLTTVESLANIGDVAYPVGGSSAIDTGSYLTWNGAAWTPSNVAVVYSTGGIADGPGPATPVTAGANALKLIRVNSAETAWEYVTAAEVTGTSHLSDLEDVGITGTPSGNQVLAWNTGAGKWEPLALDAIAYTGAYSALTGVPTYATVASTGAYADLSGKPTIPTNASFALASLGDVNIASLANNQILSWNATDGRWENVTPSVGFSTLASLTDVSVTEGAPIDGKALLWNQTAGKWEAGTVSTTTSLAALTDVSVTEGAGIDGYTLNWHQATSKWVATAPVTGGGGGGSALAILNNGTSVDTAATSINFVGATSITDTGHAVTITLPSGGGGGGSVSPPTLVNSGVFVTDSSSITLGWTPQVGNLIVLMGFNWHINPAFDKSWIYSRVIDDPTYTSAFLLKKFWSASDTTTQSVYASVVNSVSFAVFEIANASTADALLASFTGDLTTTPSFNAQSPAGLVLGAFNSTTTSVTLTSLTGAALTHSSISQTQTNESPASVVAFSEALTSSGNVNPVATFSASSPTAGLLLCIPANGGGGGGTSSSWTPLTFTGTTHSAFGPSGSALTYQQADQTFTVNPGDIIEVDAYVFRNSGNYGEVVVSQDGAYGFSLAMQGDGNQVLYCYNPHNNAQGASGASTIAATGIYRINLRLNVYDTSKTINAWGEVNGWRCPDRNVGGLVDLSGSTLKVYLKTDDITKCVARARVVDVSSVSGAFT